MSILDDHDDPDPPAARRGTRRTLDSTDVACARGKQLIDVILADCPEGIEDAVRRAARAALRAVGCNRGCLEIAFVGDAVMRRLHKRWLGKDGTTDAISFDLREHAAAGIVDGQLVVCCSVARRRARQRGQDWHGELLLYVVHGCLHLGGLDDHSADAAAHMHTLEDRVLGRLGWGTVYASREAPSETPKESRPEPRSVTASTRQHRVCKRRRTTGQRRPSGGRT